MLEAAFSDVVEVILIVLLIYFGFKILLRWFGPIILRYFLRKIGKQVEKKFGQFGQYQNKTDQQPLGRKPGRKPKATKEVGEYIDYEEID